MPNSWIATALPKNIECKNPCQLIIAHFQWMEVCFPVSCHSFSFQGTNRENKMLLEKIHERKKIFMSPCEVNDRWGHSNWFYISIYIYFLIYLFIFCSLRWTMDVSSFFLCLILFRYILRFAICSRLTDTSDVLFAWGEVLAGLDAFIEGDTKTWCVHNMNWLPSFLWAKCFHPLNELIVIITTR